MAWILFAVAALGVWLVFERHAELFVVSWKRGELRVVRGQLPNGLRLALAEALTQMRVERTTVRAARVERGARLTASGLDDFRLQRLRNLFHLYPVSRLKDGSAPAKNRVLRWIGLSSLIWLLGRRDD